MKENGCASDQPMTSEIQTRLKNFNDMGKLKRQTLMLIASYMPPDEVAGLKNQFEEIDTDKSGAQQLWPDIGFTWRACMFASTPGMQTNRRRSSGRGTSRSLE